MIAISLRMEFHLSRFRQDSAVRKNSSLFLMKEDHSSPMMFIMVKSGGNALLILSTRGYTPLEKQTLSRNGLFKE